MPKTIQDVDWSYIAALIDGEGSLTISKHRTKTGNLTYRARLTIGMNDPHAIKFMQELFGGTVRLGKKKIHSITGEEYAPAHIIEYGAYNTLVYILTNVRKFTKVKTEQVDALLEFLDLKTVQANNPSKFKRNGYFNNYYVKLKSLKHKYWIK